MNVQFLSYNFCKNKQPNSCIGKFMPKNWRSFYPTFNRPKMCNQCAMPPRASKSSAEGSNFKEDDRALSL